MSAPFQSVVEGFSSGARVLIALTVIGLGAAAPLPEAVIDQPNDPIAQLDQAQNSYNEGVALLRQDPAEARRRFERSAALYSLVRDGGADNAALHYNLGNAQLQAGRVGAAVASYLRAERDAPGDVRVQQNLAHARTLVADRFERVGSTTVLENVASWWHVVSLSTRMRIALWSWVVLWLLIALRAVRPGAFTREGAALAWRWSFVASVTAAIISGSTVAADVALDHWRPRGVIIESGVVVRKGNGEGFEPQFQESLGEGVEFRVRDRRPGWIEIELPNGRGGWVRESEAESL